MQRVRDTIESVSRALNRIVFQTEEPSPEIAIVALTCFIAGLLMALRLFHTN